MRWMIPILFFCIPMQVFAQQIPLEIKGDGVEVVKIDVVRVFKEDATVVKKFPFTVSVPVGAGFYLWKYPAGVVAIEQSNKIEIKDAPNGPLLIQVRSIGVNLDANGKFLGFKEEYGSATYLIGGLEKPKVDPPPPASDPIKAVTFIGPNEASLDVVANAALRARLKSAGVSVWVYAASDPDVEKMGFSKAVADVGGVPCIVVQGKSNRIIGSVRITTLAEANNFFDPFLGK